jgi:hypothetical protein
LIYWHDPSVQGVAKSSLHAYKKHPGVVILDSWFSSKKILSSLNYYYSTIFTALTVIRCMLQRHHAHIYYIIINTLISAQAVLREIIPLHFVRTLRKKNSISSDKSQEFYCYSNIKRQSKVLF